MSFWYLQFSQKTNKKIRLHYYGSIKLNCFHSFLGELKTPKRHFEINWPLADLLYSIVVACMWAAVVRSSGGIDQGRLFGFSFKVSKLFSGFILITVFGRSNAELMSYMLKIQILRQLGKVIFNQEYIYSCFQRIKFFLKSFLLQL